MDSLKPKTKALKGDSSDIQYGAMLIAWAAQTAAAAALPANIPQSLHKVDGNTEYGQASGGCACAEEKVP